MDDLLTTTCCTATGSRELQEEPVAAVRAVRLSKRFGARAVLDQVSLELRTGEAVALLGQNGAGKTTLLGCLASVSRPSAGEVLWFGRPAGSRSSLRRWVGLVGHESRLYRNLTVRENLLFAARMHGVAEPCGRVAELLGSSGLRAFAHHLGGRLSSGVRQRLALVRAIVHDPPIVLLDEPFSSLDVAGTDWLLTLLGQLRDRKRAICYATHDREKVRLLADRALLLESGRLYDLEVNGSHTCKTLVVDS